MCNLRVDKWINPEKWHNSKEKLFIDIPLTCVMFVYICPKLRPSAAELQALRLKWPAATTKFLYYFWTYLMRKFLKLNESKNTSKILWWNSAVNGEELASRINSNAWLSVSMERSAWNFQLEKYFMYRSSSSMCLSPTILKRLTSIAWNTLYLWN